MPKIFEQDFKDQVVQLVHDKIVVDGDSIQAASRAVATEHGISPRTARQWFEQASKEDRLVDDQEKLLAERARLLRERDELKKTNELLKAASEFFD